MYTELCALTRGYFLMLTCPVCLSDNVRRSRRRPALEFVKRWRGLQRYRCRECRKVFHRPLLPHEDVTISRIAVNGRGRSSRYAFFAPKRRRHAVEFVVFFALLVIFYMAFKALGGYP